MNNLHILDLNWTERPRSIGAVLLESAGKRALIDPGPESTLPMLRKQLAAHGVEISGLDAILLTHIHLDHAGATGSLVRENPRLAVYVHEKGAPHMADPAKLLSSAGRLYGEAMQKLYGEFIPVPAANLKTLQGGETIQTGERPLQVLYTPGHASHHVTYWDEQEKIAFVGDTAGICVEGDNFILPAVPPPDIDIAAWNHSLDAIEALHPKRLFLTHFGFVDNPTEHIARYRQRLDDWVSLARRLLNDGLDEAGASQKFVEETAAEIRRAHTGAEAEHYIFNGGLFLSWLGLARYIRKREALK
ncbi:MAG TPA: MBL fold metallo-hydrolase [Candidatus Acidoferrum sp.]|nr:MBL fold metallo-hydrolase [Candidatus Acidoferrum sp.]